MQVSGYEQPPCGRVVAIKGVMVVHFRRMAAMLAPMVTLSQACTRSGRDRCGRAGSRLPVAEEIPSPCPRSLSPPVGTSGSRYAHDMRARVLRTLTGVALRAWKMEASWRSRVEARLQAPVLGHCGAIVARGAGNSPRPCSRCHFARKHAASPRVDLTTTAVAAGCWRRRLRSGAWSMLTRRGHALHDHLLDGDRSKMAGLHSPASHVREQKPHRH